MESLNLSTKINDGVSFEKVYLDEGIVEQEHGCRKIPNPRPSKVEHLTNIAHVSNFRMTKTEFPKMTVSADCKPKVQSRKATYQTIKDVYSTDMATTTVTIRPGTRPKTE